VTVFSADAGSDVPSETTDSDVRVHRFRSLNPDGAFYLAPQLALAVSRAEADVVHAHNYHAFPLFFAALGTTADRFVVTPHYHGESASRLRDVLLSAYRPLGRWAIRQADEVVAVSDWEQGRLQEDFGVDTTVIPNGVDVERFANAEPEHGEFPYLLCVGRLEEYKGVQHVIRALPELPEYQLVIAGDGLYREQLKQIARDEAVADRVDFLGYVDDDRLPGLYAGAEAYVTMSEFEAYGITVAEALAAGTPCVIRRIAGLSDWAERDDCIGIEQTTQSEIATTIRQAVSLSETTKPVPDWNYVIRKLESTYHT
jgi:glycosyltransferase involved in cell wall biosynthesis